MGSGSLNAMAMFEAYYKDDLDRSEAMALVARAIRCGDCLRAATAAHYLGVDPQHPLAPVRHVYRLAIALLHPDCLVLPAPSAPGRV